MSNSKKSRSDATLKVLPPARQSDIAEYARTHSLAETVKWLAADGVKTSNASLSDFLSWYALSAQFRADEVTTQTLLDQLKAEVPGLTDAQLDELGQRTFSLLAIRNQDADTFVNVRSAMTRAQLEKAKLTLREKKLSQDERKIVLMEKKAAQADAAKGILENKELSQAQREARMREVFGISK
jgi:hypothetical protein